LARPFGADESNLSIHNLPQHHDQNDSVQHRLEIVFESVTAAEDRRDVEQAVLRKTPIEDQTTGQFIAFQGVGECNKLTPEMPQS
jgi:glutathionylspermidine synthase